MPNNLLPVRDENPTIPEGVHGELRLPPDITNIEDALWEIIRVESRRGGYKLGTKLNYKVEWVGDSEQCVTFEVTD